MKGVKGTGSGGIVLANPATVPPPNEKPSPHMRNLSPTRNPHPNPSPDARERGFLLGVGPPGAKGSRPHQAEGA